MSGQVGSSVAEIPDNLFSFFQVRSISNCLCFRSSDRFFSFCFVCFFAAVILLHYLQSRVTTSVTFSRSPFFYSDIALNTRPMNAEQVLELEQTGYSRHYSRIGDCIPSFFVNIRRPLEIIFFCVSPFNIVN